MVLLKFVSEEGYEIAIYDATKWEPQRMSVAPYLSYYTLAISDGEYKPFTLNRASALLKFERVSIQLEMPTYEGSALGYFRVLDRATGKTIYQTGNMYCSISNTQPIERGVCILIYFKYNGKEYVTPFSLALRLLRSGSYENKDTQNLHEFAFADERTAQNGKALVLRGDSGLLYIVSAYPDFSSPKTRDEIFEWIANNQVNLLDYIDLYDDNPLPPAPDPDAPGPPAPPAPAPSGYGKYRYTLYRVDYMRDGEDVMTPAAGVVESSLAGARLAEYVTEDPFRDGQDTIIFQEAEKAVNANYMRVARTSSDAIYDYANDTSPLYYWVDEVEQLATPDSTVARLSITRDYFMSDVMQLPKETRDKVAFSGELIATTEKPLNVQTTTEKTPYISPEYSGAEPTFYPVISDRKFAVVLCGTDARGDTFQCAIPSTDTSGDTIFQVAELQTNISIASTAIAYRTETNNISVQRLYVIPQTWADIISTSGEYDLYYEDADGVKKSKPVKVFSGVGGALPKTAVKVGDYILATPELEDIKPYTRVFFKTPARTIELTADQSIEEDRRITIYAAVSWTGAGSNGLTIYAFINGDFVDISDDFTADFAVNAEALRQAQQSELTALRAISAAVGAVGGITGGVASGNYFGAVQSGISGVSTIAQLGAAKKTPATMRNGGSAMNGILEIGEIAYITVQPKNKATLNAYETRNGYLYPSKPWVIFGMPELEPPNLTAYYRVENAKISGLKTGGQAAERYIASRLETGVRFTRT